MAATMQRRKLLILENDRALRRELEAVFSDLEVTAAEASEQTLALVRRTEPDVVLFDLGTAREPAVAAQSLELLRQILNISPDTKIIAMTEHDARELAVSAVGLGAADFYHKPLDAGVLSIVVRRALRIRELEEENWRLRERTGAMALEGIIGVSDCDAQPVPRDREGGTHQCHRAAAGRQRHGQGAAGACAAPALGPLAQALRGHQLRGDPRHAARERAVRLREGRLHRSRQAHRRQARVRRRRHGVPR